MGVCAKNPNHPERNKVSNTQTLADLLPKEIQRCQELLTQYASIGPAGQFGAMFIRQGIAAAHKAMIEGDLVGMIQAYEKLKGTK
jgi:hypothetical protein